MLLFLNRFDVYHEIQKLLTLLDKWQHGDEMNYSNIVN